MSYNLIKLRMVGTATPELSRYTLHPSYEQPEFVLQRDKPMPHAFKPLMDALVETHQHQKDEKFFALNLAEITRALKVMHPGQFKQMLKARNDKSFQRLGLQQPVEKRDHFKAFQSGVEHYQHYFAHHTLLLDQKGALQNRPLDTVSPGDMHLSDILQVVQERMDMPNNHVAFQAAVKDPRIDDGHSRNEMHYYTPLEVFAIGFLRGRDDADQFEEARQLTTGQVQPEGDNKSRPLRPAMGVRLVMEIAPPGEKRV